MDNLTSEIFRGIEQELFMCIFLNLLNEEIRVEVTLYEPRSLRIDKEGVDGREESSGGKDWVSGGAILKIVSGESYLHIFLLFL